MINGVAKFHINRHLGWCCGMHLWHSCACVLSLSVILAGRQSRVTSTSGKKHGLLLHCIEVIDDLMEKLLNFVVLELGGL